MENSKYIKECFRCNATWFQNLMLDIRNNLILKENRHPDIGKAHTPNIPENIDPTFTTFGLSRRDPCTVSDVIHGEYINYLESNVGSSEPGKQIDRGYDKPFDKYKRFGKICNADLQGSRAKNILYWFKRNQPYENLTAQNKGLSFSKCSIPTPQIDSQNESVEEVLKEILDSKAKIKRKQYMSHINTLRLQIKKQDSKVCFFDLMEHFICIDENKKKTVSLKTFYEVLKKVKINPDHELFESLLEEFKLISEDLIYYEGALNLLNWKFKFPPLPYMADIPKNY